VLSKGTLENPMFVESALPIGATYDVTYVSSNPAIASITPEGIITPVAVGTTKITATDSITGLISEKDIKVVVPNPTLDGIERTIIFQCAGDSLIDGGSSGSTTGLRPKNKFLSLTQNGAWVNAFFLLSDSDYEIRADAGKSGDTTAGLLSRLPDILKMDADLIVLQIGINDAVSILEESKVNYKAILDLITASGKSALVLPITARGLRDYYSGENEKNIELNAYVRSIAANMPNVEVAPDPVEYNELMVSGPDNGGVSGDNLHPNIRGALMQGKIIADFIDDVFPSRIIKNNILPANFSGTSGKLLSGATGVAPDGVSVYYGNGYEGPIDRGDGRVWWKLKTSGGTVTNNSNLARMFFDTVNVNSGKFISEAVFSFVNAHLITKFRLSTISNTSQYAYADVNTTGSSLDCFEDNFEYRMKIPSVYSADGGKMQHYLEVQQALGDDVEIYVTDNKTYKTDEIEFEGYSTKYIASFILPGNSEGDIIYGDGKVGSEITHEYPHHGTFNARYGTEVYPVIVTGTLMPTVALAATVSTTDSATYNFVASGATTYSTTIDGEVKTGSTFSHTFTTSGQVTVVTKGTDADGNVGRVEKILNVVVS
jgi:lysophospholipase L1-like esterase